MVIPATAFLLLIQGVSQVIKCIRLPLFLPLLSHFKVDPLWFGIMVTVNLQTAFLSPPVAMAAFYLKGVSPPNVTLIDIYWGMMYFMALQVVALFIVFFFPEVAHGFRKWYLVKIAWA